jgi:hypothetical protein
LEVFQTTSVPEFNDMFKLMVTDAKTSQYITGGPAVWPSVDRIVTLASNSYRSMVSDGSWTAPTASDPKGYQARRGKRNKTLRGLFTGHTTKCWNCDGPHHSKDCPLPKNQARFDANKAKWEAARDAARKSGGNDGKSRSGKSQRKMKDGKPMIRNKHGVYVLDQAKLKEMRAKSKEEAVTALTTSLASLGSTPAPAPAAPAAAPAAAPDRATQTRALVVDFMNRL